MNIDEAVGALEAPGSEPVEQAAEALDAPAEEISADTDPADDSGEADEPGDADAEEEQPAEAEKLEPPQWWDAEDKAEFAAFPPEVQAKVLKQEEKREAVLQKAKTKADEAAKVASTELEGVRAVSEKLGEWLPKAVEAFKSHWGSMEFDFAAYQKAYGTDKALLFQDQFNKEQKALAETHAAQVEANARRIAQSKQLEKQKLAEIVPELADPSDDTHRQKLVSYLRKKGVEINSFDDRFTSALEAEFVYKAMKYDEAEAAAKARKAPPKPVAPTVKPGAGQAHSSQQRSTAAIKARLAKTGSIDDAVALLEAQGL